LILVLYFETLKLTIFPLYQINKQTPSHF